MRIFLLAGWLSTGWCQKIETESFTELKFKPCRNLSSESNGFFEINFYSHCENIGTKNVPLSTNFEFESTRLLPIPMAQLHMITFQWNGAQPICLNDLILQDAVMKFTAGAYKVMALLTLFVPYRWTFFDLITATCLLQGFSTFHQNFSIREILKSRIKRVVIRYRQF